MNGLKTVVCCLLWCAVATGQGVTIDGPPLSPPHKMARLRLVGLDDGDSATWVVFPFAGSDLQEFDAGRAVAIVAPPGTRLDVAVTYFRKATQTFGTARWSLQIEGTPPGPGPRPTPIPLPPGPRPTPIPPVPPPVLIGRAFVTVIYSESDDSITTAAIRSNSIIEAEVEAMDVVYHSYPSDHPVVRTRLAKALQTAPGVLPILVVQDATGAVVYQGGITTAPEIPAKLKQLRGVR